MPRVDHVIYGARDLDTAAEHLATAFGLESVEGGVHPQWGTANRLVGLGDSYLEVLAGPPVADLLGDGPDRLLGWMVRTDDIDADATRLGLDVVAMTRTRPDGIVLSWRLAGWGLGGALPVFIQWDTPWEPGGGARLDWIELSVSPSSLGDWVGDHDLPLRYTAGDPGVHAVGVRLPDGREVVVR
ncbi:MAG TPA: VOC family protein [Acidimicrobiales bacterium]|nr:VOC family protein [Acidimicrobiales bacterium]